VKGNNHEKVILIEDRREAIIQGSKLIDKDDCLVILGKGHEETQEASGKKVFFSDHGVVNEIYK
jgi:UDP-N-acetylmuramoyl-L-alanyl-D-glutamate--2,6-diaminopimelate ligase